MTIEDRLRRAIAARTSRVEPSPGALHHIEEKLMDAQQDTTRKRTLIGVGAAAAVIALVLAAVTLTDDDGDSELDVADDTSTTEETSTTVEDTTSSTEASTTTSFDPVVDPRPAVWPRAHTAQRFESPVAAAQSFAVDFLGFVDPVVGDFRQGDSRSGEVPVQAVADGPETTVLVRQLEDDTWFVIGADTADITLDSPEVGEMIDCPVQLTGRARAFEGHVDVAVRSDFVDEPIGEGFVTGSSDEGGGPFDGEVDCDVSMLDDGVHFGAIVLSTTGGEDGRLWTAEVVRVQLK